MTIRVITITCWKCGRQGDHDFSMIYDQETRSVSWRCWNENACAERRNR